VNISTLFFFKKAVDSDMHCGSYDGSAMIMGNIRVVGVLLAVSGLTSA
jgi:hypothetical protein